MQYTEEQVQDLLHLRRVFYGRQGQLLRQRRDLVNQLSAQDADIADPAAQSNYPALTGLAADLRANAAEEQILLLQCSCACFRGVGHVAFLLCHLYCNSLLHTHLKLSWCAKPNCKACI